MKFRSLKRFLINKFGLGKSILLKFSDVDSKIKKLEAHNRELKKSVKQISVTAGKHNIAYGGKKDLGSQKFSLNWNRERLLSYSAQVADDKSRLLILKHLFRLRNFAAATEVAKQLDVASLSNANIFLVIRCFLSGKDGAYADCILESFLSRCDQANLSESEQITLADLIYLSGFSVELKVSSLSQLFSVAVSERARQQSRFQEFRLRLSYDTNVNVLDYAECHDLDLENPRATLRYIPHLKAQGHSGEARKLLDRLFRYHGMQNPALLVALINFDPLWTGTDFSNLPLAFFDRLDILSAAYENRQVDEKFDVLFETCLNRVLENYSSASIYQKDKILSKLLRLDLLDELLGLIEGDPYLPNTVLAQHSAYGLRSFIADDFLSARDHFFHV